MMPPSDGEGTPPGTDDELLATVIPLRRREREPVGPRILADEPGNRARPSEDPAAPAERSVWDAPAGELRRRRPPATAGPARGRAVGAQVLERRRPRHLFGALAAATLTITAAAAVALTLGTLDGQSGGTAQRAGSRVQASQPISAGPAEHSSSRPHGSGPSAARSHRTPATPRTAKTEGPAGKLTEGGVGTTVSATAHYRTQTPQSSTPTAVSSPPAVSAPAAAEDSSSGGAAREFGFEG